MCDAVAARPEPVVLVGHSRGGLVITQAAERLPDRIARLVYVCAFLPANGESLLQLAQRDTETLIFPHLEFVEEQGYITLKDESVDAVKEVFCGDCSDEEVAARLPLLRPEPLATCLTPITTTAERFGRIPRAYILATRDRAIVPRCSAAWRRRHLATR